MGAVIDHVGLVVRSIDAALPYFVDRVGLSVVEREELPLVGVRVAYLAAGATLLQLVEPTGPGPILDQLESGGEGLHHVAARSLLGPARTIANPAMVVATQLIQRRSLPVRIVPSS